MVNRRWVEEGAERARAEPWSACGPYHRVVGSAYSSARAVWPPCVLLFPFGVHDMPDIADGVQCSCLAPPTQTNLQRGAGTVPYSQRLCPRGCAAAVDTEQHVLFECQATGAARARYWDA
jgi:hypothetical protein